MKEGGVIASDAAATTRFHRYTRDARGAGSTSRRLDALVLRWAR